MAERFSFDPESCCIRLSELPYPDWTLDRLIGRSEHVRILKGALPFFDDEGIHWQFMLDGMQQHAARLSRAFLFCGAEGCGKRTLEFAFLNQLCEDNEDEFRAYEFSLQLIFDEGKAEALPRLDTVMSAVAEMCRKPEYEGTCLYLSFGDIRPVLKKKKLADRFAYWIGQLPSDETHMSVTACRCHKHPSELPESIQRAFRILYLDYPSEHDREQYFQMMMKPYQKLVWEKQPADLAAETEGFSFRMLHETGEMFYAWIMAGLQEETQQPGAFITGTAEEPFIIPMRVCEMILENIRSKQPLPKKKERFAQIAYSAPAIPAAVNMQPQQTQTVQPEPVQNQPAEDGAQKESKLITDTLKTPSEVRKFAESMRPIAILQVITSIHNTDPQAEQYQQAEAGKPIPAEQ